MVQLHSKVFMYLKPFWPQQIVLGKIGGSHHSAIGVRQFLLFKP
jgi:hypothetical protein